MRTSSSAALGELQAELDGEVLLPGATGYEAARKPPAGFHDRRPLAIARCRHAPDVAATLAFAQRSGLHVTPRSGGHCFAGRSSTTGIVIDVAPMHSVSVSDGAATVGAGTRLGDLYDRLDERNVALPAGCGATVGIAGLTLGGGLGLLGRAYGLTCDHLLRAKVVLADGRVVDCDEHHHAELFWALRGAGGGRFGVVTDLVYRTLPAVTVTTFLLTWPHTQAAALIAAWQNWSPAARDELTASLRVTASGDAGRPPVVSLFGTMIAGEAETISVLDQLVSRCSAEPSSASHTQLPYRLVKRSLGDLAADGESSAPVLSKSEFFRQPLPAEAISALLRILTERRPASHSRELAFTPMGGAYNRRPSDATAFVHRDEHFLLEHILEAERDTTAWVRRSWTCTHPWGSGRVYPNFPDPDLTDWAEAYFGSNHDRLLSVKRAYDPKDVFRFHQSLAS